MSKRDRAEFLMATYRNFDELPPDFDHVIDDAGRRSLFLSEGWFDNFIETVVGNPARLRIFAASVDGAGLILPMREGEGAGRLAMRELRGLSNFYASRFEPLQAQSERLPVEAIASVVTEISNTQPRWDIVDISPYDSECPVMDCLAQSFRASGWAVQTYRCFRNPYLVNEFADFASYFKTRNSQIRKTTANRVRAFDKVAGNSFRIVTSPGDVEAALRAFGELYEKRWHRSEPYPRFLSGLARMCAERGWLRIGIAEVAGSPAAAQIWIVKDGIAYIFKVAYDKQYTKMSVGNVALFKMFQHVLDHEAVTEVDFLTGDDEYKKAWMSHSREMTGLRAFNKRTVKGIASACRHIGGRMIRARLGRRRSPAAQAASNRGNIRTNPD